MDELKALPGVLAQVRRVFDLAADPEAIRRDLSADPDLRAALEAWPGLRPAGDWIDAGEDAPSDRLATVDAALAARAEAWRPWRAYGAPLLEPCDGDGRLPRQSTPMTLTLDRIASPVGEVLVATDPEGAVRALDFHDYEDRMRRLLHRHYGPGRTGRGTGAGGGASGGRSLFRR